MWPFGVVDGTCVWFSSVWHRRVCGLLRYFLTLGHLCSVWEVFNKQTVKKLVASVAAAAHQ